VKAGATQFQVGMGADSLEELLEGMQRFAQEVMPLFG
jgi:hypothetical protein